MSMERAVERLAAAVERAGMPRPVPARPDTISRLKELEHLIAPMRVPAELLAYWEAIEPGSLCIEPLAGIASPAFSADWWASNQVDRELAVGTPRRLMPIHYAAQVTLLVELDDGDGGGGSVFEDDTFADAIELRYPTVVDLVDRVAWHVEHGNWEVSEAPGGVTRLDVGFADELAFHPPVSKHDLLLAGLTSPTVSKDPEAWPARWRMVTTPNFSVRGRDITTGALQRGAPLPPPGKSVSVWGAVIGLVSAMGAVLVIDDGTGPIVVDCPAGGAAVGIEAGREYEFELRTMTAAPRWARDDRTSDRVALYVGVDREPHPDQWHGASLALPRLEVVAARPLVNGELPRDTWDR